MARANSQLTKIFYKGFYTDHPTSKFRMKGVAFSNSSNNLFNNYQVSFLTAPIIPTDNILYLQSTDIIPLFATATIVSVITSSSFIVSIPKEQANNILKGSQWIIENTVNYLNSFYEDYPTWTELQAMSFLKSGNTISEATGGINYSNFFYADDSYEGVSLNYSRADKSTASSSTKNAYTNIYTSDGIDLSSYTFSYSAYNTTTLGSTVINEFKANSPLPTIDSIKYPYIIIGQYIYTISKVSSNSIRVYEAYNGSATNIKISSALQSKNYIPTTISSIGTVSYIDIVDSGFGFVSIPTSWKVYKADGVTLSTGVGLQISYAIGSNGELSSITIINGGTGYSNGDRIEFTADANNGYIDHRNGIKIRFSIPHKLLDNQHVPIVFDADEAYLYFELVDGVNTYEYCGFYINLFNGVPLTDVISFHYDAEDLKKWRFEVNVALTDIYHRMEIKRNIDNFIRIIGTDSSTSFTYVEFNSSINKNYEQTVILTNGVTPKTLLVVEKRTDNGKFQYLLEGDSSGITTTWHESVTMQTLNSVQRNVIYYPVETSNYEDHVIKFATATNYAEGSSIVLTDTIHTYNYMVSKKMDVDTYLISGFYFDEMKFNYGSWKNQADNNLILEYNDTFSYVNAQVMNDLGLNATTGLAETIGYDFIDYLIEFEGNIGLTDGAVITMDNVNPSVAGKFATFQAVVKKKLTNTSYILNGNAEGLSWVNLNQWKEHTTGYYVKDVNLKSYGFQMFGASYKVEINKLISDSVDLGAPFYPIQKRTLGIEKNVEEMKKIGAMSLPVMYDNFGSSVTNPFNAKSMVTQTVTYTVDNFYTMSNTLQTVSDAASPYFPFLSTTGKVMGYGSGGYLKLNNNYGVGGVFTPSMFNASITYPKIISTSSDLAFIVYVEASATNRLWRSRDFGTTWEIITPPDSQPTIANAKISDNGQVIVSIDVSNSFGYVRVTSDYGKNWNTVSFWPATNECAMSSNGRYIYVATGAIGVDSSNDYGTTFVNGLNSGTNNTIVSCSLNGKYVVTASGTSVYISNDYGITFSPLTNAPVYTWTAISMSGDGRTILAGRNGGLDVSYDHGTTWNEIYTGATNFNTVKISSNGNTAITSDNSTQVNYITGLIPNTSMKQYWKGTAGTDSTYALVSGQSLMMLDLSEFNEVINFYALFNATSAYVKEYEIEISHDEFEAPFVPYSIATVRNGEIINLMEIKYSTPYRIVYDTGCTYGILYGYGNPTNNKFIFKKIILWE